MIVRHFWLAGVSRRCERRISIVPRRIQGERESEEIFRVSLIRAVLLELRPSRGLHTPPAGLRILVGKALDSIVRGASSVPSSSLWALSPKLTVTVTPLANCGLLHGVVGGQPAVGEHLGVAGRPGHRRGRAGSSARSGRGSRSQSSRLNMNIGGVP